MDGSDQNAGLNGSVRIVDLPPLADHPAAEQILERRLYKWFPPSALVPKLPGDYSVVLECWLCRDGVRRFTPANPRQGDFTECSFYDASAFALETSVGGRALLWARKKKAPTFLLGPEPSRLFYEYSPHLREHLGPTRKLASALNLCAASRQTRGEKDVLPADIGLNERGEGERWSVGRLKEEGRRVARQRGFANPTEDDIVRLGLFAAAELNPLPINSDESDFVTRTVLFRLPSEAVKLSDELLLFVATQVRESINKKERISDEEFRKWIEDPHSTLIRTIQRASRDKLAREQIRAALLELAWQSVKTLGWSIDAQLRAFRDALPEELSAAENFLFEQCYLANPMVGGLPLILLHDRFDLLGEVVPDFWTQPADERGISKVRTMMYYYGVIVGNLRDAEALYKRRANANAKSCSAIYEAPLDVYKAASRNSSSSEVLHEAARTMAVKLGHIPQESAEEWLVRIESYDEAKIIVELCDPARQIVKTVNVSRIDFDNLVRRLATD